MKCQLDETIDQEISHLSMLKKILYKDIDVQKVSEKELYEHRLLSENLSKYCKDTEKMLEGWSKKQEVSLAVKILEEIPSDEIQEIHQHYENQVDLFKAEITQSSSDLVKGFGSVIGPPSAKLQGLFASNKKLHFPQTELDDLIGVFEEFHFVVSHKDDVLELKAGGSANFQPRFDPDHMSCSLSKVEIICPDVLPAKSFKTICQILKSIRTLKDTTLHFQRLTTSDFTTFALFLSNFNLKMFEEVTVSMDLTET